ncbi:MAG: DinB family protein [Pseudomonadota bacterium]
MITPAYCQMMARYNAWQNKGLREMIPTIAREELYRDRGAFFGSIMGTLNHVLWGDATWISRFDGGAGPDVPPKEHLEMTPTPAVWAAERFRMDARISLWAQSVSAIDLTGDLTWTAALSGDEMSKPMGLCVVQLFNHQTHHRGQVHAMLTAMGLKPNDTDLPFMPED